MMKSGALLGVVLLMSGVAVPQAAADPCRWIAHDLPLPDGSRYARTTGSSENNRYIVGETEIGPRIAAYGLLWDNGSLVQMASPGSSVIPVHPTDVNNSGVVVGTQDLWSEGRSVAFRYRDGVYEMLYTPADHSTAAKGINERGDVIGDVWHKDLPNERQTIVWPIDGPVSGFVGYRAVGISDDLRSVQLTRSAAAVVDLTVERVTELPGGREPMVFDNDRVLYPGGTGLVEYDLDGRHVATWEGGTKPLGRTSSGHVVFGSVDGTPSLWQWGIRYAVDSAQQPEPEFYGDISDEGALIGTYRSADGRWQPARWFWCG
ncbi:hypothetical protein [Lentzea sp.]|uniref:hypothetical protein n=1 Tax=Lentzea sp. TaxID=56099 RepID=UPI002D8106EF|nr:hypothetical protein [Lentzea sp.]